MKIFKMKNLFVSTLVFMSVILLSFTACKSSNNVSGKKVYKARFEVKALCSNYTFSVIEGNIDPSLVVANYKDETTGKSYKNAFAVKNPCIIPTNLKEGDTFYFVIDDNPPKNECVVCMAYYPTPSKSLDIKIVK